MPEGSKYVPLKDVSIDSLKVNKCLKVEKLNLVEVQYSCQLHFIVRHWSKPEFSLNKAQLKCLVNGKIILGFMSSLFRKYFNVKAYMDDSLFPHTLQLIWLIENALIQRIVCVFQISHGGLILLRNVKPEER